MEALSETIKKQKANCHLAVYQLYSQISLFLITMSSTAFKSYWQRWQSSLYWCANKRQLVARFSKQIKILIYYLMCS